jgi:hypothetical protein
MPILHLPCFSTNSIPKKKSHSRFAGQWANLVHLATIDQLRTSSQSACTMALFLRIHTTSSADPRENTLTDTHNMSLSVFLATGLSTRVGMRGICQHNSFQGPAGHKFTTAGPKLDISPPYHIRRCCWPLYDDPTPAAGTERQH